MGINLLELLGAFAHFTLLLSILVLLASTVKRLWVLTAASFISAILCAMLVAPHFSSIDKPNDAKIAKATDERGVLILLKGNGKGKSSSALGTMARSVGSIQRRAPT